MGEVMSFPETWEEFEKYYGFTDSDKVYTNGARLIPSFRVEQWLEHLESERKKQEQQEEDEGCPYYTTRMETRYLSDAQMCKVYALTGKVMRSAEQKIGHCMGTKNMIECYCDGLKERCDHK